MSGTYNESRNGSVKLSEEKSTGKNCEPGMQGSTVEGIIQDCKDHLAESFENCEPNMQESTVEGIIQDCKDHLAESFEDMNLRKELLQGLNTHAFTNPTLLQQRAIVPLTKGYDVVIQTSPGTGKKTTMAIAVLQRIDPKLRACQALILSPSETVAEQMQQVITDMGDNINFQCHSCITGNSIKEDVRKLQVGVHVVVGNFERICDLINRKALMTHELKIFVIEDAGGMLSSTFRNEIHDVMKKLKSNVQLLLLSSFVDGNVLSEFEKNLHYPALSVINNVAEILRNEEHFYISVFSENLKAENFLRLRDRLTSKQSVIFCQTKQKIDWIKKYLQDNEFVISTFPYGSCEKERDAVVREFCSGNIDVLITNDTAIARRVQQVSLIINYDFPTEKEKYIAEIRRKDSIHRKVISFITENEKQILKEVEDFYKIEVKELLMFDTDLHNVLGPETEQHHCEIQRKDPKRHSLQRHNDFVVGSFEHMNLREELLQGIHNNGLTKPKPLQQKAIPPSVNGYDVLICADKRAGKTTTLAIATLQNIDTRLQRCQALALSCTRHDALHMLKVLDDLGDRMKSQCRAFIGGTPVREDVRRLEKCIHIVVGTPGRIYDLINRKCLRTSHIKMLILDETSVLFSKQQRDQTRNIFQALNSDIQILLSSTSASDAMEQFKKILKEPICIVTPKREMNLTAVKQFYLPFIKENLIFETISNLYIKLTIPQSVIFCNRKHKYDYQKDEILIGDLTVSTFFRDIGSTGKDIIMKEFCSVCDHVLISTGFLNDEYNPPVSVIINYDLLTVKESYLRDNIRDNSYFHKGIIVDISERGKENVEELTDFLS